MIYTIFLGIGFYNSKICGIEQNLPINLSNNAYVYCFEYPQFSKLILLLLRRISLVEKINTKLIIYHSFALFPFGRSIFIINIINHIINIVIFKFLLANFTQKTIIITFTPEIAYISKFIKNRYKIIYYVIDNYLSLPAWNNALSKIQFKNIERRLISLADLIITVSPPLLFRYKKIHTKVRLFRTPSISKYFLLNSQKINCQILEKYHIKPPIIGFMGSLYDWKIDIEILDNLIKSYPNTSFVFTGYMSSSINIHINNIVKNMPSNIHILNNCSIVELPSIVSSFNVCIIPYSTKEYGQFAYPVKMMEYLALGKPVVTTAIPSIKEFGNQKLIYWSKDYKEFIDNIDIALKELISRNVYKKRLSVSLRNDWSSRINHLTKIINEK